MPCVSRSRRRGTRRRPNCWWPRLDGGGGPGWGDQLRLLRAGSVEVEQQKQAGGDEHGKENGAKHDKSAAQDAASGPGRAVFPSAFAPPPSLGRCSSGRSAFAARHAGTNPFGGREVKNTCGRQGDRNFLLEEGAQLADRAPLVAPLEPEKGIVFKIRGTHTADHIVNRGRAVNLSAPRDINIGFSAAASRGGQVSFGQKKIRRSDGG